MNPMRRIPNTITEALDATGKRWTIELGGRHRQIRIDGQLVGILPLGKINAADRATRNTLAQIRRAARA